MIVSQKLFLFQLLNALQYGIDADGNHMTKGMNKLTSGWATWKWLAGVDAKQKQWFVGTLRGRGGYEAWTTHLARGLQDNDFLLKFETTNDPWERSKLVGQKISDLRKSFSEMAEPQRAELAKQGETELRTGLELLGRDKKTIQELIELVDPPPAQ
jgi:hypothetical protein